jgi:hypothetical protein
METVGGVYKAFQTFKAIMAALVFIAGGVVVYLDPTKDIVEHIPQHRGVGIALAIFGMLFLFVIFGKGKSQVRLRALLLIALAGGVLAGIFMLFGPKVQNAIDLAKDGKRSTAVVLRGSSPRPNKSGAYPTSVRYPEGTATLYLKSRANANAQIPVRVLPDRPEVATPIEAGERPLAVRCAPHEGRGHRARRARVAGRR